MANADNPDPQEKKLFVDVPFEEPLTRGDTLITGIQIRRPMGGALRGLTIKDVIEMDYVAIRTLVPRISTPALTLQNVDELCPADLLSVSMEISSFFISKAMLPAYLQT